MVDSNPRARWPQALQREFEEWEYWGHSSICKKLYVKPRA